MAVRCCEPPRHARLTPAARRARGARRLSVFTTIALVLSLASCGPARRLVTARTAHEAYADMLRAAGLDRTAMGAAWLRSSEESLRTAVEIATPIAETGYFQPSDTVAVAWRVSASRGRRLAIDIAWDQRTSGRLFVDLFVLNPDGTPSRVASLASEQPSLAHDVEQDGQYVLRLQPELLRGGRFTVTARTLASLPLPIQQMTTRQVQSVFGVARDAGARRHEGIDIFSPAGTPVTAVTSGFARASTNTLGGNVIWLHDPAGRRTFYYAHLERWAIDGMAWVQVGSVLGYVGNTGNARRTAPHLHFGLYEAGAVDPLPYLRPDDARPSTAPEEVARLGRLVRVAVGSATLRDGPHGSAAKRVDLARHTVARIVGMTGAWARLSLPDRTTGYLPVSQVVLATTPVRRRVLTSAASLLDEPRETAAIVGDLPARTGVEVIGRFGAYELLRGSAGHTGWALRSAHT